MVIPGCFGEPIDVLFPLELGDPGVKDKVPVAGGPMVLRIKVEFAVAAASMVAGVPLIGLMLGEPGVTVGAAQLATADPADKKNGLPLFSLKRPLAFQISSFVMFGQLLSQDSLIKTLCPLLSISSKTVLCTWMIDLK